jgi:hypothetical protein
MPRSRAGQTDHAFRALASVKTRILRWLRFCLLRDGIADGVTERIELLFVPAGERGSFSTMDRLGCVDPGANTEVVLLPVHVLDSVDGGRDPRKFGE